jgi:transcriptional regulator of met regulon
MSTKETNRLRALAGRLSENRIPERHPSASLPGAPIEAHRPHGEKGDFLKVTATLSPEVYKLISDEMQRRKLAREPNAQLSAILREAVVVYLGQRT